MNERITTNDTACLSFMHVKSDDDVGWDTSTPYTPSNGDAGAAATCLAALRDARCFW